MNQKELQDLKIYMSNLSAYYQRPLSDVVIRMYADDLKDLSFDQIMRAYESYRRDGKNRTMPIPAQIRAMVEHKADAHDVGVLTAAKVMQAVSKFGHTNSEAAMEFIGPLGVAAIRTFGGWLSVCENLGSTIDVTTFQAQIREIVKSESKMVEIGAKEYQIGSEKIKQSLLERSDSKAILQLFSGGNK